MRLIIQSQHHLITSLVPASHLQTHCNHSGGQTKQDGAHQRSAHMHGSGVDTACGTPLCLIFSLGNPNVDGSKANATVDMVGRVGLVEHA